MNEQLDWDQLPIIWTEGFRGAGLLWRAGSDWFSNDPAGPRAHSHDGGSETMYVQSGAVDLVVGSTPLTASLGDFIFVPANTFHDLKAYPDMDLLLFVLVAPNLANKRWRFDEFKDSDFDGVPSVTTGLHRLESDLSLPGDARLRSRLRVLAPGEVDAFDGLSDYERVVFVVEGSVRVEVGRLTGSFRSGDFLYVAAETNHRLENDSRSVAKVLIADAPFPRAHPAITALNE